jgi:hypothetical protein
VAATLRQHGEQVHEIGRIGARAAAAPVTVG